MANNTDKMPVEILLERIKHDFLINVNDLIEKSGLPSSMVLQAIENSLLEIKIAMYSDILSNSNFADPSTTDDIPKSNKEAPQVVTVDANTIQKMEKLNADEESFTTATTLQEEQV